MLTLQLTSILGTGGEELFGLWDESENGNGREAVLCRSVDALDFLLQAFVYEKERGKDFTPYFHHPENLNKIQDEQVRAVYDELVKRRS